MTRFLASTAELRAERKLECPCPSDTAKQDPNMGTMQLELLLGSFVAQKDRIVELPRKKLLGC